MLSEPVCGNWSDRAGIEKCRAHSPIFDLQDMDISRCSPAEAGAWWRRLSRDIATFRFDSL